MKKLKSEKGKKPRKDQDPRGNGGGGVGGFGTGTGEAWTRWEEKDGKSLRDQANAGNGKNHSKTTERISADC